LVSFAASGVSVTRTTAMVVGQKMVNVSVIRIGLVSVVIKKISAVFIS
jgi:hypothetical protein